ncbi:MAG: metallophosphoesterase [Gemmatimonadales bacterium]|nr:metallophosphoesterase [Gemmatimonadales bacterium]
MPPSPRILLYSDLHREFPENRRTVDARLAPAARDLVILAGDTDVGAAGVTWAAKRFPDTPVAFVLGNHEAYHQPSWPATVAACRRAARGTNVRVLHRNGWTVAGVRVLGCTLWTDYSVLGAGMAPWSRYCADRDLADSRKILTQSGGPFRAEDAERAHRRDLAWLRRALRAAHAVGLPTVVVTHHAPLLQCDQFARQPSPLTPAFVNNLEAMMHRPDAPMLWCSGHTHSRFSGRVGRTYVHANQLGYVHRNESRGFLSSGRVPQYAWERCEAAVPEDATPEARYARLWGELEQARRGAIS